MAVSADQTVWGLVARRTADDPGGLVAVDDGGDRVTAAELVERSESLARQLAAYGIGSGDVVSWILPSRVESLVLLCALARLGAVQNPIVPIYGEKEIAFITGQVGARLLVTPGVFRGVDFAATGERMACPSLQLADLPPAGAADPPPAPSTSDAVRWLFYTSGSTADPKGVRHTDRSIIAAGNALRRSFLPGSRWGGAVPIAHVGVPTVFTAAVSMGVAMHFIAVFDPVRSCEQLRDWGVDTAVGIGAVVSAMLDFQKERGGDQFPALRVMLSGGGPKHPTLFDRARDELGCALLPSYGMTECPYISTSTLDDPDDARAEGEGRPSEGVDVRIVAEDGRVVEPGAEGEIRVRAPQAFAGYVDPTLDVEVFDEHGYLRTGDLGYLAAGGHVVITGRIKEVVVRNGENLGVRDIEDLLLQHPSVLDATVIGLPDAVTGERVCAVVVPRPGADVALDELRSYCAERGLMRQKHPEQLAVVDAIPRNPMGKARKPELRRQLLT